LGTWDVSIDADDVFHDVYDCFFHHYNGGASAEQSASAVMRDCVELFSDTDDQIAAYFALALAQWETRSLGGSVAQIR